MYHHTNSPIHQSMHQYTLIYGFTTPQGTKISIFGYPESPINPPRTPIYLYTPTPRYQYTTIPLYLGTNIVFSFAREAEECSKD